VERDKALDMAVGQIEKQFGKGAVMRLGDQANQTVASIPTGAISLDLALGVGGIPRGRVTEIYGPEASGKCVVAGTHVWTDRGLETIEELFARCGQPTSCTSRVTDVRQQGLRAVNEHGELEGVAALTHNNRKPVVRLELRTGRSIEVTHNHPLRVVSEHGSMVWRQAGEIREGDTVASAAFGAEEAAEGDGLDEDEAVLLGYLTAQGSLSSHTAIRFIHRDPEVGQDFTDVASRVLGDVAVRCDDGKEYAVFGTAVRGELEARYGFGCDVTAPVHIPHCVRTAGGKMQRAFLSALFEGDGWIDESSTIGWASASHSLAQQVQLLLLGLGIPAALSAKTSSIDERDSWTVTINPEWVRRFFDEIGFRATQRQSQVEAGCRAFAQDQQLENASHGAGLAGHRYLFERVEQVEEAGDKPTFDLMLPQSHSFLANGVLSHNTTVALHVVAEAQQGGGVAAFIDAEHALDPSYAKALGVDTEELLVSQPDTGEQALEIADMLVRSGAVDVIVIDSVAALTPKAEIEGEMGDSHVGLQARLMSQALRKLSGTLHRSRTSAVFINQLREKVGVMFGCFDHSTRVTLADGTQEKIGEIVDRRLPVEVLSYDAERDEVVPKPVTNWFDNGPTEAFLQFSVDKPTGDRPAQFACTPNHLIRTPGGWREAAELCEGDRVLQTVTTSLSDEQWEIVLGAVMGNATLSPDPSGHRRRLGFGHRGDQAAYAEWKASLFSNVGVRRYADERGAVFYDVQPLAELGELSDAVDIDGTTKTFSDEYLKQLTPRSLAVWYMDAGGFPRRTEGRQGRRRDNDAGAEIGVEAMDPGTRRRLQAYLRDTWGIEATLVEGNRAASLQFPAAETRKLHQLIACHVHPSMQHALRADCRGHFANAVAQGEPRQRLMPLAIRSVRWAAPSGPAPHRYDLEVEGTHNYFVDGVMVHNSPETTPGGRALKFYSSVRLDVRRIESLKDGNDAIGNRVRTKVVKNKCVAAGTRVVDAGSGETLAIEDIVANQRPATVWSADKRGKLHLKPVVGWFDQGHQEVIPLALQDGTTIRATADHLMLTDDGWRPAGELRVGDCLARPRLGDGCGSGQGMSPESAQYLPEAHTAPVLAYLAEREVTAADAASLVGEGAGDPRGGLKQVLGSDRLRRDRLERLAGALDSSFLREVLEEDVFYDPIATIGAPERKPTYDIEVADLHNFVAEDVVVHNCAPPFKQAEFDIMYGTGISKQGALLDLGVEHGIVKKAGAWYTYDGEQLGQGRENAKKFLAEHDDVTDAITKQLHEQLGLVPTDATGDGGADGETGPAEEAEGSDAASGSKKATGT
jgi:recombination protein RecA